MICSPAGELWSVSGRLVAASQSEKNYHPDVLAQLRPVHLREIAQQRRRQVVITAAVAEDRRVGRHARPGKTPDVYAARPPAWPAAEASTQGRASPAPPLRVVDCRPSLAGDGARSRPEEQRGGRDAVAYSALSLLNALWALVAADDASVRNDRAGGWTSLSGRSA